MKSQLHSLFYKKYSLLPIQVYLLFQLVFVIIISLLRYLKFEVNGDSLTFNSSVLLTIISFSFLGNGVLNASVELRTQSYKQVYLNNGSRMKAALYILLIDLLECLTQSVLAGLIVMMFSQGIHSEVNFYYYLFGSVVYFLAGYSFSFLCGNSMIALAILLLFPILVLPFIDRVLPIASSVIIYDLVFQLIHTNYSIMRFIVFIIWLLGLFFTSYCLIRKEFLK